MGMNDCVYAMKVAFVWINQSSRFVFDKTFNMKQIIFHCNGILNHWKRSSHPQLDFFSRWPLEFSVKVQKNALIRFVCVQESPAGWCDVMRWWCCAIVIYPPGWITPASSMRMWRSVILCTVLYKYYVPIGGGYSGDYITSQEAEGWVDTCEWTGMGGCCEFEWEMNTDNHTHILVLAVVLWQDKRVD